MLNWRNCTLLQLPMRRDVIPVMVAVINQPAAPLIPGLQVTNGSCNQPMASMIVIATGGTPPYSYQWSNGQNYKFEWEFAHPVTIW
jgi:hypothetical protein